MLIHNIFHLHVPNKIAKLGGTRFVSKHKDDMMRDDIIHQGNITRANLKVLSSEMDPAEIRLIR
jgi:hypothetical protein